MNVICRDGLLSGRPQGGGGRAKEGKEEGGRLIEGPNVTF